ncbi:hypothetical protein [Polaromonas sp. SM01]|uniref:hypothetical protein n=1 Tax=Polaromonas sp. SM01 TaxID=3085630 RepID=UPI002980B920|nr:hypothetical protein [Polaromonas sp. SM01]MDW5444376.1 hypothetical protein [Polaromonas sp. SM01]
MRAVFSILSLLVVVAVIGVLAKKQLSPTPVKPSAADGAVSLPVTTPGATPQQQSQQIQQQVRQTLENAMQQARPMPEDKP